MLLSQDVVMVEGEILTLALNFVGKVCMYSCASLFRTIR